MNGIRLRVRSDASADARQAIDAAIRAAFAEDQDGLVWLNGAIDTNALAESVAKTAWQVNGRYCHLVVDVDWSDAMPGGDIESVGFTREHYERLIAEGAECDEGDLVLCEHWADLNSAAIEAVRALAEISKQYPYSAFELVVIGCEEYPYVPTGIPRRADPPGVRLVAQRGRYRDESVGVVYDADGRVVDAPDWAVIRAAGGVSLNWDQAQNEVNKGESKCPNE